MTNKRLSAVVIVRIMTMIEHEWLTTVKDGQYGFVHGHGLPSIADGIPY